MRSRQCVRKHPNSPEKIFRAVFLSGGCLYIIRFHVVIIFSGIVTRWTRCACSMRSRKCVRKYHNSSEKNFRAVFLSGGCLYIIRLHVVINFFRYCNQVEKMRLLHAIPKMCTKIPQLIGENF